VDTARKSLARDSASHPAFFCYGTFSVELWLFRAPLISRRGATLASPWQQILAKNHVEGAAPESLEQRSASRPSFWLSYDNGTCIVELWLFHVSLTSPRQQNFPKKIYIHIESLENRWRSGPQVAQLFFLLYQDNKGACIVELWLFEALLTSRRRSTGTIKAHSVLKFDCFSHRSSHDGVRRLPHHGSRNWQKKYCRGRGSRVLGAAVRNSPLFCSARTIMVRSVSNFGCFTHRSVSSVLGLHTTPTPLTDRLACFVSVTV